MDHAFGIGQNVVPFHLCTFKLVFMMTKESMPGRPAWNGVAGFRLLAASTELPRRRHLVS